MNRLLRNILIALAAFLLVCALFVVITTPSIAGHRQRMVIKYHHNIKPVKVYTRSGDKLCAKAIEGFEGKAWIGHEHLLGGGMSIKFCYQVIQGPLATSHIIGKPHLNTWADGRWGWSFDGITSRVKGHGKHCSDSHCWEYVYRRYYYKFTRGFKGFSQTCTPYINITVRGNGSYVTGHSDGGVC